MLLYEAFNHFFNTMELFGILMILLPLSMAFRRREKANELPGEWLLRK